MGELYDTSWAIHVARDEHRNLRAMLDNTEEPLKSYQTRLSDSLKARRREELDDLDDKTGGLKETTWKRVRLQSGRGSKENILISVQFEKSSHKFLLSQPSSDLNTCLLLCKATAALSRQVISHLSSTYDAAIHPLQLTSNSIQYMIESYLSTMQRNEEDENLHRAIIGTVKMTILFSAPVAPKLKSLDLDIPSETIKQLSEAAIQNRSSFLTELGLHIQNRTGIDLNLGKGSEKATDVHVLRLSKASCSAFAVSAEGRLRLSSKSIDIANQQAETVQRANEELLKYIAREANRQNNT